MQPSAKVICDSISEAGHRLTTMEVVMHRYVLAEFNTHRVFSRNSASSRAIPVSKIISRVVDDPAMPISWGKNQKGMQANEELSLEDQSKAQQIWLSARSAMVDHATRLMDLGVHKQITNRLLEPFMMHTAIVSFTEFDNFATQRCSPLAQPEMAEVAFRMREARDKSIPVLVDEHGWHCPYTDLEDLDSVRKLSSVRKSSSWNPLKWFSPEYDPDDLLKISVARCARVSYLTHDGKRDIKEDIAMFERLRTANPPHMSPFEHVATPYYDYGSSSERGNFIGWTQFRHIVFGK